MRTYPIHNTPGRVFAFEVENAYVSPAQLARVLAAVDGVADVRMGPDPGDGSDVRGRFAFRGRPCVVFEPWGDSSRYWVGPDQPEAGPFEAGALEAAVLGYRLPALDRVVGDLLSLRIPFLSRD